MKFVNDNFESTDHEEIRNKNSYRTNESIIVCVVNLPSFDEVGIGKAK